LRKENRSRLSTLSSSQGGSEFHFIIATTRARTATTTTTATVSTIITYIQRRAVIRTEKPRCIVETCGAMHERRRRGRRRQSKRNSNKGTKKREPEPKTTSKKTKLGLRFSLRLNSIKYRLLGSWNSEKKFGGKFLPFCENLFLRRNILSINSLFFEKKFAKTLAQPPTTCKEVFKIFFTLIF
jgi:hypothetical protein